VQSSFSTRARVGNGDDIASIEAMKMEIPVAAPASGKLKSLLAAIEDVVAGGPPITVIEV
jgi:biotin carboxyl carrier protein